MCRCAAVLARHGTRGSSLAAATMLGACVTGKYQHAGVRRRGATGDGVPLIDPGWAAERSLTVTALPSSVQGVLVLRVVGEVDLATVGRLREQLHHYIPGEHRGMVWIAPGCHSWLHVGLAC